MTKEVKINLGSGFVGLRDWINYDNSIVARISKHKWLLNILVNLGFLPKKFAEVKWPPITTQDCRKNIPLKDNSVDFVYTSHFLEHLYRFETIRVIKECFRVMKSGATIRIALPDMDKIIKLYLNRDKKFGFDAHDNKIAYTPADILSSHFYAYEWNQSKKPGLITRLQELFLRRHKWMYTAESMINLLKHIGFKNIKDAVGAENLL